MQVRNLPKSLWVVTNPTTQSKLGDVCYEYDFIALVRQLFGGLQDEVVGIFIDKVEAITLATKLLHFIRKTTVNADTRFHKSPFAAWYATQESLDCVVLCEKDSDQRIVIEPPLIWGQNWAWNISSDRSGILIFRIS